MPPEPQGGLGQSWFVLEFQAEYAGDPTPQIDTGRSVGGFEYGPVGYRFVHRVPVEALLSSRVRARLPVGLDLARRVQTRLPVSFSTSRGVKIRIPLSRQPAWVYSSRLREDEELLIALLLS